MPLYITLIVIQTSLLILVIFFIARCDWSEEKAEEAGRAYKTLLGFIFCMTIAEGAIWFITEIVALVAVTNNIASGIETTSATLAINVVFILSLVMAILNERRLAPRED